MNNEDLVRLERHAREIGDPALRWEILTRVALAEKPNVGLLAAAVGSMIHAGDPRSALELADLSLQRCPDELDLLDAAARAAAFIGAAGARDRIDRCVAASQNTVQARVLGVERYLQIGALDSAESLLADLDGLDDPNARAAVAEYALWSMDLERARRYATDAMPRSTRVLAACDILEGEAERGLAALDRIVAQNTRDDVAHCWRAEALMRLRNRDEALKAADMAMTRAASFSLTGRIIRFIVLIDLYDNGHKSHRPELNAEILDQLRPLHGPEIPHTRQMLVDSLAAFGGNRSCYLTTLQGGRIAAYARPPDPRAQARRAQMVVKIRGKKRAQASLDQLLTVHPGHPLVHTYRGEFKLWCGQYDEAYTEFRAAIAKDPKTKWAWIGAGACKMIQGELQFALDLFEMGIAVAKVAGPTLWIYQGETRRLMGDLDGSWKDLVYALQLSPRRLSTQINMALVQATRGDEAHAAELVSKLRISDPDLVGQGTPVACLERALRQMRGNRSSSLITWFTDDGRLRLAHWPPPTQPKK